MLSGELADQLSLGLAIPSSAVVMEQLLAPMAVAAVLLLELATMETALQIATGLPLRLAAEVDQVEMAVLVPEAMVKLGRRLEAVAVGLGVLVAAALAVQMERLF